MDLLTLDDIRTLMREDAEPCVSLYMQTHRVGTEMQKDPTRYRNLLREARTQLSARNVGGREMNELLEQLKQYRKNKKLPNQRATRLLLSSLKLS